jgi:hypothetical protein
MIGRLLVPTLLLFVLPVAWAQDKKPAFEWKETDTSIALFCQGKVVWQHVHDKKTGKPYMRLGLLDGTELTRPCPYPKNYARSDHPWHKALWWSWKYINRVNFWEGTQEGTEPVKVKVEHHDDGSALLTLEISYHQKDQPPIVHEKRVIRVSAPDERGSYCIDWEATFTPAGEKDVVFNKNSYGGFAYRGAAEYAKDKKKPEGWVFLDSEGRKDKSNNQKCRWVAFIGTAQNGKPAAIAMFDHPSNPRHPSWWQTRNNYPYLNPSFTCKEDYTLKAGEKLVLKYLVMVHEGKADQDLFEGQWRKYAGAAK